MAQRAFRGARSGPQPGGDDRARGDIDVRDELEKVRAETLVCHSKQDGNAPLVSGQAGRGRVTGARFVELDSANHILLGNRAGAARP